MLGWEAAGTEVDRRHGVLNPGMSWTAVERFTSKADQYRCVSGRATHGPQANPKRRSCAMARPREELVVTGLLADLRSKLEPRRVLTLVNSLKLSRVNECSFRKRHPTVSRATS